MDFVIGGIIGFAVGVIFHPVIKILLKRLEDDVKDV